MTVRGAILLAIGLVLSGRCDAQAATDAATGEEQFEKARAFCHAAEPNAPTRQGPNLRGVYGRSSAQMAGFKCSDALAGVQVTGDEATLDRWLTNPATVVPDTVMMYRQREWRNRAQIIAYLKSLENQRRTDAQWQLTSALAIREDDHGESHSHDDPRTR